MHSVTAHSGCEPEAMNWDIHMRVYYGWCGLMGNNALQQLDGNLASADSSLSNINYCERRNILHRRANSRALALGQRRALLTS